MAWLMVVGLAGAIFGVLSDQVFALFVDADVNGSNTMATGVLIGSASPTTALLTVSSMQPGDEVTAKLSISAASNSTSFRYAVWYSTSSPSPNPNPTNADGKGLRAQLRLTIRTGDSGAPTSCTAFTGTVLYVGQFMGRSSRLIGDPTQGAQTGDRTLAAGATDTLCFGVQLPWSTPNTFASASTTATFTLSGEQVTNNP